MPKDNKRVMERQSVVKMKFASFVLACSSGESNTISQLFSVQIPVQLLKKPLKEVNLWQYNRKCIYWFKGVHSPVNSMYCFTYPESIFRIFSFSLCENENVIQGALKRTKEN